MSRIVLSRPESQLVIVAGRNRDIALQQASQQFAADVQPILDDLIESGKVPKDAKVNLGSIDKGKDKGKVELTWDEAPAPKGKAAAKKKASKR